jgi:alpha-mannosidase
MPDFKPYTRRELDYGLSMIGKAIYTTVAPLQITAWRTAEPVPYAQRRSGAELHLKIGDKWGDLFDCAWFNFTGQVPPAAAGQTVVLLLDVNGEMYVADSQGNPLHGLTSGASDFDYSLGSPAKRVVQVSNAAQGGETIDLWCDAGCNDLFGNLKENGTIQEACIAICRVDIRALYYDFEVLLDFLKVLPAESPRAGQVQTALYDAMWGVASGRFSPESIQGGRTVLATVLSRRGGDPDLQITAVGHAHIDLGWLWPIRETKRKGARTFSTALTNMQRYPDYVFGASQPQLFQWIKDEYPTIYEQVKQRVKEGRFEVQGAMWVEADTNVSGGEALVRQVLLGKRFFQQEFGIEIRHLWLPDVFGYSAALPQILKRAGVDIFMTQKMSWNQVNKFPHHSFFWQGLDGTRILASMLPEETYNSPALPRSVVKIEQNYKEKGVSDQALMLFGIGDGGGGPGEEHLERLARLKNLSGLSPVTQAPAAAYFEAWQKDAARFPAWVGELYLERHSGTLTTEARNKKANRRIEQTLRQLEWMAVFAGTDYPAARLETIWREMLLYQFHDILPGSSIKRVYDESLARYAALQAEVDSLTAGYEAALAAAVNTADLGSPAVLFNSLSWERTGWEKVNGAWVRVTVPSLGYQVVDAAVSSTIPPVRATPNQLENDLLRVTFAADGSITSLFDKAAGTGREIIPAGQAGNQLAVYSDAGDAWDFPLDYADQTPQTLTLVSAVPQVDGPRAVLVQTYRYGRSELIQEISLTAGSRCLAFNSRLNWLEPATMLRTSFPVAVHAESATYEIQFGSIQRPTHQNTTWDLARDEVAAHKYVDLSQGDYGLALLNDCKYGHKIKGNRIDLNLLRSAPYPGQRVVEDKDVLPGQPHHGYTDQGEHTFRYALLPHAGNHIAGGVIRAGYEFNIPLRQISATAHPGNQPATGSFLALDAPNVIVEAIKKAEDSDAVIIRLYEAAHASARATLRFAMAPNSAEEVNLMEETLQPLSLVGDCLTLEFAPFEIKTIKVQI